MKLKSGDWLRIRGVHVVRPISGFLQTHRYKAKIGISMYKFTTPLWLSPISWKLTLKIVGCHEIHMFFFVQHLLSPHSHSTPQKQPHEKPAPGRAVRIAALPVGRPGGRTKLLRTAWKTVKPVAAMVEKRMELSNQNGFIKVYQAELRLNGWTWMGFKVLAINQQDFLDIRWSLWWTHNEINGWRWPCSAMLVYHRVISNRWNFKPHVCRDMWPL